MGRVTHRYVIASGRSNLQKRLIPPFESNFRFFSLNHEHLPRENSSAMSLCRSHAYPKESPKFVIAKYPTEPRSNEPI
jgi:hypothetical protein